VGVELFYRLVLDRLDACPELFEFGGYLLAFGL
jgi:hypothetical protein